MKWIFRLNLNRKINLNHERERELYEDEGDLELGEEADVGVEERDGVGDLDDVVLGGGRPAEEDGVDGRGLVLQGVEYELCVRVLRDLVPHLAAHDSVSS